MNNTFSIPMSLPLDGDGFLRRACPTCEREFKWLPASEGEESAPVPDGGYFCPYCGIQAPADAWFTQPQIEHGKRLIAGPALDQIQRGLEEATRGSGGIRFEVTRSADAAEPPSPLKEADDMRRVDFVCHPSEPVKLLDEWDRSVHCLLCGQTTS